MQFTTDTAIAAFPAAYIEIEFPVQTGFFTYNDFVDNCNDKSEHPCYFEV